MAVLQIIATVFGVFALSRVILRGRENKLSFGELIFWLGIWIGLLSVAFFPGATSFIAGYLNISRGIDLMVYASIPLLFYMIFRIYVKLEESEQEITKLVREIALMRDKKEK